MDTITAELFRLQDEGKLKIFVSALTMVNTAYVYKKTVGQNLAIANLKYLSTLVKVLPINEETLQKALLLEGKDFEDTLQTVCAAQGGCDILITRNSKDFRIKKGLAKQMSIPAVYDPDAFLQSLSFLR